MGACNTPSAEIARGSKMTAGAEESLQIRLTRGIGPSQRLSAAFASRDQSPSGSDSKVTLVRFCKSATVLPEHAITRGNYRHVEDHHRDT